MKGQVARVHATGSVAGAPKPFWSTRGEEPFEFQAGVGRVIKGWDQGCLGMRVGEVRRLVIPADEGYGSRGFPAWGIPGGATLDFQIELVSVSSGDRDL